MKNKSNSPISRIQGELQHKIKLLKRKKRVLKAKAILLVVLPIVVVLISLKGIKTYLHIRLERNTHQKKSEVKRCEEKTP